MRCQSQMQYAPSMQSLESETNDRPNWAICVLSRARTQCQWHEYSLWMHACQVRHNIVWRSWPLLAELRIIAGHEKRWIKSVILY
jgi:hypothetical protein